MSVNDIPKVIYAPHKIFKEIIQNPRYWGPFVVLIIFVVAQVGSSYIVASRSYIEQTMPVTDTGDVWTQNAALWQANSGVIISNNTVDYIGGTYFGGTSIEFAASNASSVWMGLNNLDGSVNCGVDGFKNISLRVKIVTPSVKPENVSLYLYSLSASNFYYDLTNAFSNTTVNVWNNITLPVGSGGWLSSNNAASWENITGLKMEFTWFSNSSVDLLIDGLFFRGVFENPLEIYGTSYIATLTLDAFTPFIFQWLLLTVLMYAIIKGLKGNATWKPLMVAVGFALVTMAIQALISIAAYTTLPKLYYPLEVLAGVPGESNVAYKVISDEVAQVSLISSIVQVVVYVWTIALGAIITRNITAPVGKAPPVVQQFGWIKSILVSGASFVLTILILSYVLGI